MIFKALDPGTRRLGWASWEPAKQRKPRCGFYDLRGETEGATFKKAYDVLVRDLLYPQDIIVMEGLLLPPGSSIQSRFAMFGVRAIVIMAAHDVGAKEPHSVAIHQWRSWSLGMATAPKSIIGSGARRKWLKARAQNEVEARGWGLVSDDEAEAMLMLCWLRAQFDMNYAMRTRPALPIGV